MRERRFFVDGAEAGYFYVPQAPEEAQVHRYGADRGISRAEARRAAGGAQRAVNAALKATSGG